MPRQKEIKREARKSRIRRRVSGTPERPRLSVFRSLQNIYAQVIDDTTGVTLVQASTVDKELAPIVAELRANPPKAEEPKKDDGKKKGKDAKPAEPAPTINLLISEKVGEVLAQRCKAKNIENVVFDRNGYMYHGRVKKLADGARKGGLSF
jgi:large subunit ribosomal protein L18